MEAFRKHTGLCVPMNRINVDTDQIIPKQFLKRIERTGFGAYISSTIGVFLTPANPIRTSF